MLNLPDLRRYVAGYEESPPRTLALEQRIRIGTGFHKKWYRSQKDHWLGWILVQECKAIEKGKEPQETDAEGVWKRLKCSPMMFWLAEASGVSSEFLDLAERNAVEASRINPKDGLPHGDMIRGAIIWHQLVEVIQQVPPTTSSKESDQVAIDAFMRLTNKVSTYKHLRKQLLAYPA